MHHERARRRRRSLLRQELRSPSLGFAIARGGAGRPNRRVRRRSHCLSGATMLQYVSGETSGASRHRLSRHIEDCPRCSNEAGRLSRLPPHPPLGDMVSLPLPSPPLEGGARILQADRLVASCSRVAADLIIVRLYAPGRSVRDVQVALETGEGSDLVTLGCGYTDTSGCARMKLLLSQPVSAWRLVVTFPACPAAHAT